MEEQQIEMVGRAFVEHYYQLFDTNRPSLCSLYQPNSLLTFEGQRYQGVEEISTKINGLPFDQCLHSISTIDSQPSSINGGIIVFVSGSLLLAGEEHQLRFSQRWEELINMRRHQMEVVRPFIQARRAAAMVQDGDHHNTLRVPSYVDSLLRLEIEVEGNKRKLTEEEIFNNCSEFINGGTDTTVTALEWIMANLVKHPEIQSKLYEEIKGVLGGESREEVGEDELPKMPYLKAIVLEGLRRHPPTQLLLPHGVTQEVELGGYRIPKNAVINFTVADMGRDPTVWEHPMEFKPERFLSNGGIQEFSFTGSHEIKMLPFGAGRRMCAGISLAMLHMEYLVANLIWKFEWLPVVGKEVDLAEMEEFTVVMKHPLHARLSPRTIS